MEGRLGARVDGLADGVARTEMALEKLTAMSLEMHAALRSLAPVAFKASEF